MQARKILILRKALIYEGEETAFHGLLGNLDFEVNPVSITPPSPSLPPFLPQGILVGSRGSMIHKIREEATQDLEELFQCSVDLSLHVKV